MNARQIAQQYHDVIVSTLRQRGVLSDREHLPIRSWAGPEFTGVDGFIFEVDQHRFQGKIENLHDQATIDQMVTNFRGNEVGFTNTQGFAFWVLNKKVPKLQQYDLLSMTDAFACFRLYGSRNSGKTTLCQHILRRRREEGQKIVVFDPKPLANPDFQYNSPFDKWSDADEVWGMNGNYEEIDEQLARLVARSDRGQLGGQRVFVLIDEYTRIIPRLPQVAEHFIALYVNGREAGVDIGLIVHSLRAGPMGMQNRLDLVDDMVTIKLNYNEARDARSATVNWGEGEFPCKLPGKFNDSRRPVTRSVANEPAKSTPSPSPSSNLDADDIELIHAIRVLTGGEAPVQKLHGKLKKLDPKGRAKAGGPWTVHKLQQKFVDWEQRGLLTGMETNELGHRRARRLTYKALNLIK